MKALVVLLFSFASLTFVHAQSAVQFLENDWDEYDSCVQCTDCKGVKSDKMEEAKSFVFYCGKEIINEWVLIKHSFPGCEHVYYSTFQIDDFNIGDSKFNDAETALLDIYQEVKTFCKEANEVKRIESSYSEYSLHVIQHFFNPPSVDPPKAPVEPIFKVVPEMPYFPGEGCENLESHAERKKCGDQAMLAYIDSNLEYPTEAQDANIQGTVVVQFIVRQDGTLTDLNVTRSIGGGCDEAALAIIESMNQRGIKWVPGEMRGETKNVQFNLPIRFRR